MQELSEITLWVHGKELIMVLGSANMCDAGSNLFQIFLNSITQCHDLKTAYEEVSKQKHPYIG